MTYDPNKVYQWKSDDVFEISGREFDLILNTLRAVLSTEQAQQVLLAARANEALEKIIAKSVEEGKLIEQSKTE